MKKKMIFLGGTCNGSKWRESLKPLLKIDYFDPAAGIGEWTEEMYQHELLMRETCDYILYAITPEMTGFYSIAEVVEDSIKRPDKVLFCVLSGYGDKWFDSAQMKSLIKVMNMVENNGAKVFTSLGDVYYHLHLLEELDINSNEGC